MRAGPKGWFLIAWSSHLESCTIDERISQGREMLKKTGLDFGFDLPRRHPPKTYGFAVLESSSFQISF
jgi:hypothetical protein